MLRNCSIVKNFGKSAKLRAKKTKFHGILYGKVHSLPKQTALSWTSLSGNCPGLRSPFIPFSNLPANYKTKKTDNSNRKSFQQKNIVGNTHVNNSYVMFWCGSVVFFVNYNICDFYRFAFFDFSENKHLNLAATTKINTILSTTTILLVPLSSHRYYSNSCTCSGLKSLTQCAAVRTCSFPLLGLLKSAPAQNGLFMSPDLMIPTCFNELHDIFNDLMEFDGR